MSAGAGAGTTDTTQTTPRALERGAADGGSDRSRRLALYVLCRSVHVRPRERRMRRSNYFCMRFVSRRSKESPCL
jgi:hypothetical protein